MVGCVILHRTIDGQGGEVRLNQAEVIPGLIPFAVIGTFEEPEIRHAQPRPVLLDTLIGQGRVARLFLQRNLAVRARIRYMGIIGDGVGVHLPDPDRLMGISVGDHDVPDVGRPREVDVQRTLAAVSGPRPEHVIVDRQDIETASGTGIVHPLEKDQIVHAPSAARTGVEGHRGCEGTADDHRIGVGFLGSPIPFAQQLCIGLGVNRTLAPLRIDVGLVP